MSANFQLSELHLAVGKPIPWDAYDSAGNLLLRKGYVIESQRQIEGLIAKGLYVTRPSATSLPVVIDKPRNAFWLWDDMSVRLLHLLRNHNTEDGAAAQIEGLALLLQNAISRNSDAFIAASILNVSDGNQYPATHSLHSALLCALTADRLGWSKERRKNLVCAALTMNIAMVELQQVLSTQAEPPTAEQQEAIHAHPARGAECLARIGVLEPSWLETVRNHHESCAGTGYPCGINNPGEDATLLRLADVLSAKMSPRRQRKALFGDAAARALYAAASPGMEQGIAAALIKEVGLYPPGSFIRLANGEVAISHRRTDTIQAPEVLSLSDASGNPRLDHVRRTTSEAGFRVISSIPREEIKLRFDPSTLWRER